MFFAGREATAGEGGRGRCASYPSYPHSARKPFASKLLASKLLTQKGGERWRDAALQQASIADVRVRMAS